MKKICVLLFFFLTFYAGFAQTTMTVTLNPNDEDAGVGDWAPSINTNYPNEMEYVSRTWTISGVPVISRSFFKFNLSSIPSNAVVISAGLSLYYADTNSYGNLQHSSFSHSDESVIRRVTSAWSENTLTWNNQPSSTTTDQVILPQSTSGTQDYLNMNVTNMVQQMISGTNNGFLLRLTTETPYAQMFFASGDNPHVIKRPSLTVTYSTLPMTCVNFTLNSDGEDAGVGNWAPSLNTNYPSEIEYPSRTWTISGVPVISRNFFKFNLSSIPSNAVVISAALSLYYADTNSYGNLQHSSFTHSDESAIRRVTSSWSENTLTWNNQPSSTTTDEVILPQSTSGTQDYLNMNVTNMVQQMISGTNNGFLLRLTTETPYAQMFFASGDNPHLNKHPQLQVCYSISSPVPTLSEWSLILLGILLLVLGTRLIRK